MQNIVILTLHGIRKNNLPTEILNNEGAMRYTINDDMFDHLMNALKDYPLNTLSGTLYTNNNNSVVLTFDDGLITDYDVAFKKLSDLKKYSTHYVTVKNIGRKGYCTKEHLREMAEYGLEIGSHGMTHEYLHMMSHKEVIHQLKDSKTWLEDELGMSVTSYAPVGGYYDIWIKKRARILGYSTFATMVPGTVKKYDTNTLIRRNHIQACHTRYEIDKIIAQDLITASKYKVKYHALKILKHYIGMKKYDHFKKVLFKAMK